MKIIQFYIKVLFFVLWKKVMTYTMTKKTPFRFPTERYLNVVKRGYKGVSLIRNIYLKH